jgi:hypothetical protein
VDYDRITDGFIDEAPEEWDGEGLSGVNEFKAAIEAFNAANSELVSWFPNYKRALLLDPKTPGEENL